LGLRNYRIGSAGAILSVVGRRFPEGGRKPSYQFGRLKLALAGGRDEIPVARL